MDFDKPANRRGSDCYKWDVDAPEADIIPMWVADMDFRVDQRIIDALHRRVDHGVFGYTRVPQSFYEAVVGWYARRHRWQLSADWILYTSGVVPAVSAIIKALCPVREGEPQPGVLVQTPVYNCFFSSIRNNGCQIVESPLVRSGDTYVVDFDAFEAACARPEVKLFLLCNPHNPAGRVWTPAELRRMGDICRRHDVFVVADEIHNGIVMPGYEYTPFGSLGEDYFANSVSTSSSSKSFNTAGLQICYIISGREDVRAKIDRAININEVCDVNPFGIIGLQVAYNECEDWLAAMCAYVAANYDYLQEFLAGHLPQLRLLKMEGTYLAWVDCRATGLSSADLGSLLLEKGRVRVSSGDIYGEPDGYIRINLACPRTQLAEALHRMASALDR